MSRVIAIQYCVIYNILELLLNAVDASGPKIPCVFSTQSVHYDFESEQQKYPKCAEWDL